MHTTDNAGAVRTAELAALVAGDVVYVLGQAGHVELTLTADAPAAVAGVVTLSGSIATDGVAPSFSDAVEVQVVALNPAPPPPPAPYDPSEHAVADVKAYVEGLGPETDPYVQAATQVILDLERGHLDRSTLVDWLDRRDGVV